MLSAINLVDVFLVAIVILIAAAARNLQAVTTQDAPIDWDEDFTLIQNPGTSDMRIVVKRGERLERFDATGSSAEGTGVAAGTAYRMPDGSMVYVPTEAEESASFCVYSLRSMNLRSGCVTCALAILLTCLFSPHRVYGQEASSSADPPKVLVIQSGLAVPAYRASLRSAADARVNLSFIDVSSTDDSGVREMTVEHDLVIFDVPHLSVMDQVFRAELDGVRATSSAYVLVQGLADVRAGTFSDLDGSPASAGMSEAVAARIREYFRFGGRENTRAFVELLALRPWTMDEEALQRAAPAPARDMPSLGFYHPNWSDLAASLPEVETRLSEMEMIDAPRVAIAFHQGSLVANDLSWLDALIRSMERRGVFAYGFYGPRADPELFVKGTCKGRGSEAIPAVDLIINAALVFRAQQRREEMERIGVPVIQTLPSLELGPEEWAASSDGLATGGISYYFASSELAGMVDPLTISARDADRLTLEPL
ncbi:MAG: cobaltochelatase subunit CobN, partial [Planctomycetota bacterium]